jgi:hypothetical protein
MNFIHIKVIMGILTKNEGRLTQVFFVSELINID